MLGDKRRTCEVSWSSVRNSREVWLFHLKQRQRENVENEEEDKEGKKPSINERASALLSGQRVFWQGEGADGAGQRFAVRGGRGAAGWAAPTLGRRRRGAAARTGRRGSAVMGTKHQINCIPPPLHPLIVIKDVL